MDCGSPLHSCAKCPTRQTSEWSTLSDADLRLIDQAKLTRAHEPGEVLFLQGDASRGIYCLQSGLIGLRRLDEEGNSALLRLCNAGETVGYRALLSNQDHRNTAEILAPSVVCFIRRPVVARLVAGNPRLGERFLGHCMDDMTRTEADYARSLTLKMKSRFLHVLMIFYQQRGYRDQYENFVLELPIQRRQLADLLGSSPESVSRMIRNLETEGLLRFEDRRVCFSDMDAILQEIGPLH